MATLSVVFLACLVLVGTVWCEGGPAKSSKPHILFMLADDLGWTDVGFHGSEAKTPNIDRLAADGVELNNYYVQPVCTPTRAALMTGRYPIHTGLQHEVIHPLCPFGLPLDFELLPQRLNKVGYKSHLVGKWHLGFYKWAHVPTRRGFDTFYGFWDGSEGHFHHRRLGVTDFRDQEKPELNLKGTYATFAYVKRLQKIVEEHDPAKPLFMYMAFQNVHAPVQAPQRYVDKYNFIKDTKRRKHCAMVDILDEAVGNITDIYKKAGLWDNTLMIFSTDNGGIRQFGGYNTPLRGQKKTLWEGGVRGVGFVHGNMLGRKGVKCNELMHVTDWYPTLLDLAGATHGDHPIPLDGKDVWSTISEGKPSPRMEILLNIDEPTPSIPGHFQGTGIRVGHMKLLMDVGNCSWFTPPGENEAGGEIGEEVGDEPLGGRIEVALFNVTADPNERVDLSKKYPDIVKEMQARLEAYKKSAVPCIYKGKDPRALETARKNGVWGPWET